MSSEKIYVIAILGMEHSGTTLLSRILSSHSDAFGIGGIKNYAKHARGEKPCSCGMPLDACDIWSGVAKAAQDLGYPPNKLIGDLSSGNPDQSQPAIVALIHAISRTTGKRVLIESSRQPVWTQALDECDDIEVVPLHIFKSPAQQMASARRKDRSVWKELRKYLSRSKRIRNTRFGTGASRVAPIPVPYLDFCETPETYIQTIMSRADRQMESRQISHWGESALHMLGGNRMKKSKDSGVRVDTSWQGRMSGSEKRMAQIIGGATYARNIAAK